MADVIDFDGIRKALTADATSEKVSTADFVSISRLGPDLMPVYSDEECMWYGVCPVWKNDPDEVHVKLLAAFMKHSHAKLFAALMHSIVEDQMDDETVGIIKVAIDVALGALEDDYIEEDYWEDTEETEDNVVDFNKPN